MFTSEHDLINGRVNGKFAKGQTFDSPSNQMKFEDIYPDEEDTAGGIFSGSTTSRARLFSQQRDIMAKKRQSQLQNEGMVRRSLSTLNGEQITPAVRQFSAPKSVSNDSGEFSKANPLKGKLSTAPAKSSSRSEEEEEEDDDSENHPNCVKKESSATAQRKPLYKIAKPLSHDRFMDDHRQAQPEMKSSQEIGVVSTDGTDEAQLGDDDALIIELYKDQKPQKAPRSDKKKRKNRRRQEETNDQQPPSADEQPPQAQAPPSPRKKDKSRRNASEATLNLSQEILSRPFVLDLSNMKQFLTAPIPKNAGVIQCQIRRSTGVTSMLYPKYSVFLKDGDVFLMSSKKRPNNKTSNYLISMDQSDLNRQSENYLGKVRSNFLGTEYQIFDDGVSPKEGDTDERGNPSTNVRCELGAVTYAPSFTTSSPRKMQVAVPAIDGQKGKFISWKDNCGPNGDDDDLLKRIKNRVFRDCNYYVNKPPRWNEQIGGYVLNFHGRVTMASVKNFQLVDPEEQSQIILQFGKVDKDEFTMDVQYPMSLFQAFAIILSSFDSKIACD